MKIIGTWYIKGKKKEEKNRVDHEVAPVRPSKRKKKLSRKLSSV